MILTHSVPQHSKEFSNQTKLTSVTDQEFIENDTTYHPSTTRDKLIQLAFFIIFFGWLRLIFIAIITALYVTLMIPVVLFADCPKFISTIAPIGIFATRVYFRLVFFFCGFYYIKKVGKVDPKARLLLFNHQSLFDGPLIYQYRPFIVIGMIELQKAPIVGQILTAANSIFVDRSVNGGISKVLTDYLNQKEGEPLALSPEGRCTNGKFMMEFRTGSFIARAPVQPVTIRYTSFLPYGKTGVVWTHGHLLDWIIRVICMPGCFVELHFLPLLDNDKFYSKTPQEKALYCNLLMANDLSVMASDRSTREMFHKKPVQSNENRKAVEV